MGRIQGSANRRARIAAGILGTVLGIAVAQRADAASSLLLSKSRVEVSITWRSQYGGETGTGIAIPVSDGFGFFAFTDPNNPEVFVKVLDFGASNPLLLFYGGLSDFEYHVTFHNRCTGQDVRLDKAPGSFDGGSDNRSMLAGCETGPLSEPPAQNTVLGGWLRDSLARQPLATAPNLYLSKQRVQVSLTWKSPYDGSSGTSIATPINENFGFLSFFNAENPEVFVKVLDFGSSNPLLLFYGGLTDFEYEVTFKNLCTDQAVVFRKPPGSYAGGGDNRAMMAVCDAPPLPAHVAAMKATEQRFRALYDSGATPLEVIRGVGAYMAASSEYLGSVVDEETLTALGELKDGRIHIVSDNFRPRGTPDSGAAEGLAPLNGAALPRSGKARIQYGFAGLATADKLATDLKGILTKGGYEVRPNMTDTTLPALRDINGDGYAFLNTHGGGAFYTSHFGTGTGVGTGYYAMSSNTFVTARSDDEPAIADDLANDRLVYYTGLEVVTGTTSTPRTYYGINKNFVKTYWSFPPDAVVYSTVCVMLQPVSGPADFVQAILDKGAGVVFGWTGLSSDVGGYKAARYFADRLVGANSSTVTQETPDQRPFPWNLVYEDMVRIHYDVYDGPEDSKLVYKAGGKEAVLDPSIQQLLVNEPELKLYLRGDFGDPSLSHRVTVGAQKDRTDCTWKPDEIVCPLALTGDGSNGEVYVEVEGVPGKWRKSNVRQLVEWRIPLTYLWKPFINLGGQKLEGDGLLRFRADVGDFRIKPGQAPFKPLRGMIPTNDSYLTITGSGVHTDPGCTITLTGSAKFKVPFAGPEPYQLVTAMFVDTSSHLAGIGLGFGLAVQSPLTETFVGLSCPPDPGSSLLHPPPTFGPLDVQQAFPNPDPTRPDIGPFFAILFDVDRNFVVPAKAHISPIGLVTGWPSDVPPVPAVDFTLAR